MPRIVEDIVLVEPGPAIQWRFSQAKDSAVESGSAISLPRSLAHLCWPEKERQQETEFAFVITDGRERRIYAYCLHFAKARAGAVCILSKRYERVTHSLSIQSVLSNLCGNRSTVEGKIARR